MSHVTLAALLSTCLFFRGRDAEPIARSEGPVVVPGGFADDAGKVLYLTGAKDGVVAVDAESGELLWECAGASRPLVLLDRRLAVLRFVPGRRNELCVWFLDVENKGVRAVESDPLVLPEWADVGAVWGVGYGRRFDLRASRVGGELHLHWTVGTCYAGGVPPPPEVLRESSRLANGLAVVDPRTGGVTLRSLPAKDTVPPGDWGTRVAELPQPARESATRLGWSFARVVGARAYGQVTTREPGRVGVHSIQAVDLATGRLLWQRPIGEERLASPPP